MVIERRCQQSQGPLKGVGIALVFEGTNNLLGNPVSKNNTRVPFSLLGLPDRK
jgi:hypothetical protein